MCMGKFGFDDSEPAPDIYDGGFGLEPDTSWLDQHGLQVAIAACITAGIITAGCGAYLWRVFA